MRIKKILSGGQTGVDSAALDAAIEFGISTGGWVPKGSRNEYNEIISSEYNTQETPSADINQRTEWNVIDSDATLIICRDGLKGGTKYTYDKANALEKPCLVIDLSSLSINNAIENILTWLQEIHGSKLNVAGPRDSEDLEIYKDAKEIVSHLLRF